MYLGKFSFSIKRVKSPLFPAVLPADAPEGPPPTSDKKVEERKRIPEKVKTLKKFLSVRSLKFEIQENPVQVILIVNCEIHNLKILIDHFIT